MENYGRYNGYVEICIRDGLHGLLPDALPEGTRADYEYRYHCALLGDPAFAATLELTFDDAALYARERARLAGMALKRLARRSLQCGGDCALSLHASVSRCGIHPARLAGRR